VQHGHQLQVEGSFDRHRFVHKAFVVVEAPVDSLLLSQAAFLLWFR
jgi:hypothetical protein